MNSRTSAQSEDQRQEARVNVTQQGQINNVTIESAGQSVPVTRIRDVSISGVGLALEQTIAKGETITLACQFEDLKLRIQGQVAWCDDSSSPVCVGVEFSRETPRDNMLFFLAIRKYLDDFDGITMDI